MRFPSVFRSVLGPEIPEFEVSVLLFFPTLSPIQRDKEYDINDVSVVSEQLTLIVALS